MPCPMCGMNAGADDVAHPVFTLGAAGRREAKCGDSRRHVRSLFLTPFAYLLCIPLHFDNGQVSSVHIALQGIDLPI
jgi:hypothetical protein